MTTTPLVAAAEGQMDTVGQFDIGGVFGMTLGAANDMALLRFTPSNGANTYWLDASSTVTQELSLKLTVATLTTSGSPFWVYAVTPTDGTLSGFPVHGIDLPANRNLYTYSDEFTQPALHFIPAGARTLGILAGKKRITTNQAVGTTITIPLDMAAFIPAMTDQSWSGSLYLNLWLVRDTGSATPVLDVIHPAGPTAVLNLPSSTLTRTNRDTGRSGPGWGTTNSPYQRCPVTGLAILGERMVPDGYREGILVHPKAYDPPEPEPRPDFGETDWEGTV